MFKALSQAGRLGNQCYQVASTLGLARTRGEDVNFPAWDYQPFFSMPGEWFRGRPGTDAAELVPHIDPRARVYLQDYSLFAAILPELRRLFAPSPAALAELGGFSAFMALKRPILSVHVRRGDNVPGQDVGTPNKHLWHPLPTLSYYQRAIATLRPSAASVAVFSDEPEWADHHLGSFVDYVHYGTPRPKEHEPAYRTAKISDYVDFLMSATCDLHVCSNSTFGIFAALMADDETPPTVPWPIFGPNLNYIDASLLFPSSWMRIAYQ